MPVVIHQAFYGDKDGGLSLLKTTCSDDILSKRICNSTDLSDRSGPGVLWSPSIRGFKFQDYYLLIKTYPDKSPGLRSGRVFSHALIIEKKDLAAIDNLLILYNLFEKEINKDLELNPFIYEQKENIDIILSGRMEKVAAGILNDQVVVWVGQDGFEDVIAIIWKNLWSEARFDLNFGINFNPYSINTNLLPNIICTPESLVSKWNNTSFCLVAKEETFNKPSKAALYLIGSKSSDDLESFIKHLEKKPTSIKHLRLLEKGLDTYNNLESINDFNDIFQLYNILSTYKADPGEKNGILIKVFQRLVTIIPRLNSQSINALRKLKILTEVSTLQTLIESTLQSWLSINLFDKKLNSQEEVERILINLNDTGSESWWKNCVTTVVYDKLKNWESKYSNAVWKWFSNAEAIGELIFHNIKTNHVIEKDLVASAPSTINSQSIPFIISLCKDVKWYLLHARLLSYFLGEDEIIPAQLEIDKSLDSVEALYLISEQINPKLFIKSALENSDDRLFLISGKLIKNDKKLLSGFIIEDLQWQNILLKALSFEESISTLFKKPNENFIYPFLDLLINDKQVNQDLLQYIANSKFADISNYPQRKDIWQKLPGLVKDKFLLSTALSLSHKGNFFDTEFEQELDIYISSEVVITDFLSRNRSIINPVIQLFDKYNSLPEKYLQDYLYYFNSEMNSIDAKQLGVLVFEKQWRHCLGIIQSKASSNKSFKIAFQECYSMLDFFPKIFAVASGLITKEEVNENDWWQSIEQLTCHLYPEGPKDDRIWKRSGGSESDLLLNSSGKQSWHDALHKLQFGAFENITIDALLEKIKKDYPKNRNVKALIKFRK